MQTIEQTSPSRPAYAGTGKRRSIDGIARKAPAQAQAAPVLPQYTHRAASPVARQAAAQPKQQPRPAATAPQPQPSPQPIQQQPQRHAAPAAAPAKSKPARKKRGMPAWLEVPLMGFGAIAAGLLAQSALIGQLMIVVYGVVAFFLRVRSRTTFTLALLSMIATIILLTFRGNVSLSQNFATYTFLLLVVGVITLGRELKQEGGRVYSRRNY
jgi:hypothetical protein